MTALRSAESDRRLRLSLNLAPLGRHAGAWRRSNVDPAAVLDADYWVGVAQLAEAGLFDALFFADSPHLRPGAQTAIAWRFDPLSVLSAIAAETTHIGLVGTVSSSYYDPYWVAERIASLARLSGGRAAVNSVTSTGDHIAQNFGRDHHYDHATRYRRAAEFITIMKQVWAAEGRSPVANPEAVDYDGEFFALHSSGAVPAVAGDSPLVVQAGTSPDAVEAIGRFADVVYAGSSTLSRTVDYTRRVKAVAVAHGRHPQDIKILAGVVPYLADSAREARALQAELDALHTQGIDLVASLSGMLGLDLSDYDPDGPLPFNDLPAGLDFSAGESMSALMRDLAFEQGLSIRELSERAYSGGFGNIQWQIVGTASQLADELQRWFDAGAADGFNLMIPEQPTGVAAFVNQVVPELQERKIFRTEYEANTLRGNLGLG